MSAQQRPCYACAIDVYVPSWDLILTGNGLTTDDDDDDDDRQMRVPEPWLQGTKQSL